jgi:nucleotide-binding universal stress UspA family protein
MYKRILVAVDGSETSDLALGEAIKLAKDQQATLRLVHAIDVTVAYMVEQQPYPVTALDKALREAGEKILATRANAARDAGLDSDSKLIVVEKLGQHIYDIIENEAKQWPADLIVVGTHGRRGFRHLMLGSVAEGVIRVATKPVLLIRAA